MAPEYTVGLAVRLGRVTARCIEPEAADRCTVADVLPELDARVDAFYLDGFKPSHNPELFNAYIFQSIHRLAQPGASLSTYSVAGVVKQGLAAAGFIIEKRTGFGQKRALLYAQKAGHWEGQTLRKPSIQIVGAGLAGLALEQSLLRFGLEANVFSDPRH